MYTNKAKRLIWTGLIAFFAFFWLAMIWLSFIKQLPLLLYVNNGVLRLADYVNFYYAGKVVVSGNGPSAYDYATRMQLSNQVIAPYTVSAPLYCGYLPFVFAIMAPFALMPLLTSYFVWCTFTMSFGVAVTVLFLARYMRFSAKAIALFCLVVLSSFPSFLNLSLGQVGWLLLGFVILYFWGLLGKRDLMAGIFLALTSVKPQYTLVMAGAAVGLGRWKLLAIAFLTELALFVLALTTLGWNTLAKYPNLLSHTETLDKDIIVMISIRPLLTIWLNHALALKFNLALTFLAALSIALIWRYHRLADIKVKHWLVAFTVVTALLFSPHSHCHDALLLALPAMVLPFHDLMASDSRFAGWAWTSLIIVFPFITYNFYAMPVIGPIGRWPFVLYNALLFVVAILGIVGCTCKKSVCAKTA